MNDFDRLMLRLWRWMPLFILLAAIGGYSFGSYYFERGQ